MSDEVAAVRDDALREAQEQWNYPFKKETLEKHVTFAFNTRGNDLYWKMVNFLLQQTNIFRRLSTFTSMSLWGPGAEALFTTLAKYPSDYICILDTDVGPRIDTVVRMIERDKDIVSCPTWMYDGSNQDIHLNVHYDDAMTRVKSPRQGGMEKVNSTSWACVCISHRVLQAFAQAGEEFTKWSPLLLEDHKNLPPDTIFYQKAKMLGFDVWVDWDLEFATHHKYVALDAPTLETFVKDRLFGMAENERLGRAINLLARHQTPVPA
jgi:hypothetical protein